MKSNTKSSITLPPNEIKLVNELMKSLKAKSKVEVIRRGLSLLKESTDRIALKAAYKTASAATEKYSQIEIEELDHLNIEEID